MDPRLTKIGGESVAHNKLKQASFLWAQSQGYFACAMEIRIPKCRYRADVAAYRCEKDRVGSTAIFECKQSLADLRRDNRDNAATRERLAGVYRRRQVLEKHLRIHYPNLRIADSLFHEFDSHDFGAIQHRGYKRVLRQLGVLQNRLFDCTKFERLTRYGCANLFYLVVPRALFSEKEVPIGWGALLEAEGMLTLVRKPILHESSSETRLKLLERIAAAGMRNTVVPVSGANKVTR
jgi:hypothetical protein